MAQLFAEGQTIKAYPFILRYLPSGKNHHRVAFAVPKRKIPTAVKRNLIKRRCREAYRKSPLRVCKGPREGFDLVWVYMAQEPLDYQILEKALQRTLSHFHQSETPQ